MLRSRRKQPEQPNLDRWLISYADFITLLFAFFVVLYALSSMNEGEYKVLSDSLISAFNVTPGSIQPIQIGDQVHRNTRIEEDLSQKPIIENNASNEQSDETNTSVNLKKMADKIEKSMASLIKKDLIKVRRSENWLEVEIKASILFPSGSAAFVTRSLPVLSDIAGILRGFPNPINVEGFTDNVPIRTPIFPSNWELSAGRAASVVSIFEKNGVDPRRMTAIGYGEYRNISDNRTEHGRNQNRRVVLAILAKGTNFRMNIEQLLTNTGAREKTIPMHSAEKK